MKCFPILLLCLVLSCSCWTQPNATDNKLAGFDQDVQTLLDQYHAAGAAVLVLQKGETRIMKGYGFRDVDQKLPVDENTLFRIGSCSKAFMATLIGQLEGQNELQLSDRPQQYLSELEFFNQVKVRKQALSLSIKVKGITLT